MSLSARSDIPKRAKCRGCHVRWVQHVGGLCRGCFREVCVVLTTKELEQARQERKAARARRIIHVTERPVGPAREVTVDGVTYEIVWDGSLEGVRGGADEERSEVLNGRVLGRSE